MARHKHELLIDAERVRLIGIPCDRDQLAWLYTLEPSDIDIIGRRREKRNLLGVALQLALLRHHRTSLAQLLLDRKEWPGELLTLAVVRLGLFPAVLADYAVRDQAMTDHAGERAEDIARAGLTPPGSEFPDLMLHKPWQHNSCPCNRG